MLLSFLIGSYIEGSAQTLSILYSLCTNEVFCPPELLLKAHSSALLVVTS